MRTKRKSYQQRVRDNRTRRRPPPPTADTTPQLIAKANFHQGNVRYGTPCGKQCTCNVLNFLIKSLHTNVTTWDTKTMNTALDQGSTMYRNLQQDATSSYFMISQLPQQLQIEEDTYTISHETELSGILSVDNTNPSILQYSLLDALLNSFALQSTLFITIGNHAPSYTMGLLHQNNNFFIFDSHSRNSHGLLSENGYAVLIRFAHLQALEVHIKQLAHSLGIPADQFEIVPVNIQHHTSANNALQRYFADQSNKQLTKTLQSISAGQASSALHTTSIPSLHDPQRKDNHQERATINLQPQQKSTHSPTAKCLLADKHAQQKRQWHHNLPPSAKHLLAKKNSQKQHLRRQNLPLSAKRLETEKNTQQNRQRRQNLPPSAKRLITQKNTQQRRQKRQNLPPAAKRLLAEKDAWQQQRRLQNLSPPAKQLLQKKKQ